MLTESFITATSAVNKAPQHLTAALKDVGIFCYEVQPQAALRHGFKKSSVQPHCLAFSRYHVFAAQSDKAVINVYSREKGNQEATVPLPERIRSLTFAEDASVLVIGTEEGKIILWEVATGRLSYSTASHLQGVSSLCITPNNDYILSGSPDSTIFVWSLPLLLSLSSSLTAYGNEDPANAPRGTFSHHRSPITALGCGHSRPNTNFAVSASDDKTCFVWHIETCQVIRSVLLPSIPLCTVLDPVDRAVYFGSEDGAIISVDLLSLAAKAGKEQNSISSPTSAPIRIHNTDVWKPTTQLGAAHGITLSYDGTSVLTGHASGAVVQWDVAKQRMAKEVTNVGQPVTNIHMLPPEGLREKQKSAYRVPVIVKPKLELNNNEHNGTCGIPAGYNLNVFLTGGKRLTDEDLAQSDLKAMTSDGWPEEMLDDAIRAIEIEVEGAVKGHDSNLAKAERLEDEVAALKEQLAALTKFEQKRNTKMSEKTMRMEKVRAKRREAYFDAKKQGKDGDAAMKPFEEEIERIRDEEIDMDDDSTMDTS